MSDTHVGAQPVVHNIDEGMQVVEIIGEIASTSIEGAARTDDVLCVNQDTGEVFVPTEVVYDVANDAVVIKIAATEL